MKPNPPRKYQKKNQKSNIEKHLTALRRFNEWEKNNPDKPDKMEDSRCLAAVFELYEMIPEDARERPLNAEGIVRMHKVLACLK